jgi:LuxR family maltose regulon positive regulatory protein
MLPLRPDGISRTALAELVAGSCPPVVALSAAAGYGKTALMADWDRRDPRPSAWVSFRGSDNHPMALLGRLATALDALYPVDRAVFDNLASGRGSILARIVPGLAMWMQTAEPFVLFLDDLHVVHDRESRDALNLVVDHLPTGSTVVAACRGEVWLNLARRRAGGELLEIGARELAFDVDEAGELFGAAGFQLEPESVRQLHARTEGWPAGLCLAALALQDSPSPTETLERFAGDDRFIADYLRSEILDEMPDRARRFLTRSAVLDQMCASLCDQTLDSDGSSFMLAWLERTNLFLVPLDHRREWYRSHRLFRELLLAELQEAEPDTVPEMHRRAADWYEANDRPDEAIEHARASGDAARAARLVAGRCPPFHLPEGSGRPDDWIGNFREAEIQHNPWLAVVAAWTSALTGRTVDAARWADVVERTSFAGPSPDHASFESARALLRGAMCPRGITAMVADAELADAQEAPWSDWRAAADLLLLWARQLSGDHAGADAAVEQLVEATQPRNAALLPVALTERSLRAVAQGDWTAAAADVAQARAAIAELGSHEHVLSALTFAASARLAIHDRDLLSAREYLGQAMRLRPQATWALPTFAVKLRIEMAEVTLALADPAGARSLLRELDEILRRRPDMGVLIPQVEHLRHRLAILPGGRVGVATLSPAELRLLPYLQTHLTHQEIGHRLYVSLNTVRTQTQSVYRKLSVTSRAAAVEHACRIGLLAG